MSVKKLNTGVKIVAQKTISKYTISLRDDGILHCHMSDQQKWDPEACKLLFQAVGEMVNFKQVPLLVTFGGNVLPSSEGSAYWSDPKTCCPYFCAEASVLPKISLKIMGNFHVRKNKLLRPSEIFNTEKEAVSWLKTFL